MNIDDDKGAKASEQVLSELKEGTSIFGDVISKNVEMAKFVLGGVAAMLFFVADYASKLIDNPSIFGIPERMALSSALVMGFLALAACFWNFLLQSEYLKLSSRLKVGISFNSNSQATVAAADLMAFVTRYNRLKPFRWAIGTAGAAGGLSLTSLLMVLF